MSTSDVDAPRHGSAPSEPLHYREALAALHAKNDQRARQLFGDCIVEQPDHVFSLYGLGLCEARLGMNRQAATRFRQVLHIDPGNTRAADRLAELSGRAGVASESADSAPGNAVRTLVSLLDEGIGDLELRSLAGQERLTGRRPVLTHRRLWLGLVAAVLAPVSLYELQKVNERGWAAPLPTDFLAGMVGGYAMLFEVCGLFAVLAVPTAFLNARMSSYAIYDRTVVIEQGVWFRSRHVLWLLEVSEVRFEQSPLLLLLDMGRLVLVTERPVSMSDKLMPLMWLRWRCLPSITGFSTNAAELRRIQEILQVSAIRERRDAKRYFL